MSAVDSRSVTIALPTISLHFGLSLDVVQWIPLAYQLTIVGLVLSMARLGDMLGRKKVYTVGFLLLALRSTVRCDMCTSDLQQLASRALGGAFT